jgi:hypothetical protein
MLFAGAVAVVLLAPLVLPVLLVLLVLLVLPQAVTRQAAAAIAAPTKIISPLLDI